MSNKLFPPNRHPFLSSSRRRPGSSWRHLSSTCVIFPYRHPAEARDPVGDICRQPVSFGIITQVLRPAKLDTALRRYDDTFNHRLEWGGIFNNKKTDAETGIRTQNPQQISNSLSVV